MVGQGRNNLDSPRQAAKGPADTENDNAELAEDADIEDFDEEAVAKALADYLAENDLDGAALKLGDKEAPVQDLWYAVNEAGGYDEVTRQKGWSSIGRAFGASKMTDLSHRMKRGYEKMLLPFEQAIAKGDLSGIVASGHKRRMKGVKGLKLAGGKVDKLKNAKGRARAPPGKADLIGQRILVKWTTDEEGDVLFIGTIKSYHRGKYHVEFDDGESHSLSLDEEAWRMAGLKDEAEAAANAGLVAIKRWDVLHTPAGSDSARDDAIMVDQGNGYKVYQVEPAGKLGYEIHAQLPGINKEGAKVKCWPEGRVRIRGSPEDGVKTWVPGPIEWNVKLPGPIDAHSAKALLTLHGLLYISAWAPEQPTEAGASADAPLTARKLAAATPAPDTAPAAAATGAEPAALASAGADAAKVTLVESPMEGLPEPGTA